MIEKLKKLEPKIVSLAETALESAERSAGVVGSTDSLRRSLLALQVVERCQRILAVEPPPAAPRKK